MTDQTRKLPGLPDDRGQEIHAPDRQEQVSGFYVNPKENTFSPMKIMDSVVLAERAAFESWARIDDNYGTSRTYHPPRYDEQDTQEVWEAWQARARLDKTKELNQ